VTTQLQSQLKLAGVETVLLQHEYTVAGIRNMIQQVAQAVHEQEKGKQILKQFNDEMISLNVESLKKKVLFIYARGAGTMLVSGTETFADAMIELAGAQNAVQDFSDFKPLSAESLVAADPDVILMFTGGLKSMGGVSGLLKVPGVSQTKAGRNKKIITMDGELMGGFTLRLPKAIRELHHKIAAEQ